MIEHEFTRWFARLADWQPALRGGSRLCAICGGSPFVVAAGFGADDPHEVSHWLIESVYQFAAELAEDLVSNGMREAAADREALAAAARELAANSAFVRRALDLYTAPKVDEFVSRSSQFIN